VPQNRRSVMEPLLWLANHLYYHSEVMKAAVMKATSGLALVLVLLISGCGASQSSLQIVHLASLSASTDAFPSQTTLVIRDQQSWQDLWSRMNRNASPAPPVPAVDFTQDMVLVAAAGTRNTGGYSVSITGGVQSPGKATVNVLITSPGTGCNVTLAFTSPVDMATTPRSNATIDFQIEQVARSC
jgi:hypothetical protein